MMGRNPLGLALVMGVALAACGSPRVRPTLYEQGISLERQGRWDESLATLRAAVELDPTDPVPREAMARVYDQRGWFSGAVEQRERVLALTSVEAAASVAEGNKRSSSAWLLAAAAARRRAVAALLKVYLERGAEAVQNSNWTDAFFDFTRATELDDKNLVAWPGLAWAAEHAKKTEEAYRAYGRCFGLLPFDIDLMRGYGRCAHTLGHLDEALKAYQRAVTLKPGDARAWNNEATVLAQLGRYDESLACYADALNIEPVLLQALNGKASVYYYQRRYEVARQLWAHVLELSPDDPTAIRNMRTLVKMGL